MSPWTFINPVRYWRLNNGDPRLLRVRRGHGPGRAAMWATAMTRVNGDDGLTCVVPIADLAVHWDPERAPADVREIIKDDKTDDIPKRLCTADRLPKCVTDAPCATRPSSWAVDDDGVATLTLDRPDAAQRLRPDDGARAGAGSSSPTPRDDDGAARSSSPAPAGRSAPAWTSRPRATSSGSTSRSRPTPEDLRDHLDRGAVPRRRARHRRPRDAGDPRAAQAGDRRDQRRRRRHRRDHDAGDGPPAGLDQGPDRLRLRPARHRARGGSTWFLPRIVGIQQALEWVYSAEILTAEAALAGRLVRSRARARRAAAGGARRWPGRSSVGRSPVALGLAKQLLYRNSAAAEPLEAHLADSLAMFYTSIGDGKEGVAAFLEKRPAAFTGRASELPTIY